MTPAIAATLRAIATEQPYPLVFVTISGAHLYGFPSADSDYDLRGAHVLPVREVVALDEGPATIESSGVREGFEIDLVSHDVHKFFGLLLKKNGYVLEQLYSPLIVHASPVHAELQEIARGCITRFHAHHYLGFAETQWRLFEKERPRRVKPLLYTIRILLAGIHLLRTGKVEAHLPRLNEDANLGYVADLIARKTAGVEHSELPEADVAFFEGEYRRLVEQLEIERDRSPLPASPSARLALNDLLVRLRLGSV